MVQSGHGRAFFRPVSAGVVRQPVTGGRRFRQQHFGEQRQPLRIGKRTETELSLRGIHHRQGIRAGDDGVFALFLTFRRRGFIA